MTPERRSHRRTSTPATVGSPGGRDDPLRRQPRWRTQTAADFTYGDDLHDIDADDLLARTTLAAQLARVIVAVADQSPSSVVALVGPWGSGKSSLLATIRNRLSRDGWRVAEYNPWLHADYAEAVHGFFAELRAALPTDVAGRGPREALGDWVGTLSFAGGAGGLVGIDGTPTLDRLSRLLKGDQSPAALRQRLVGMLEALEEPMVVVLDDLDRLQPAELLTTFKLVRLLGRLPNVYYLLAYDEETLIDTLERTELVGSNKARARQYLEKIVQVRLDIPPLLPTQQRNLLERGLEDLIVRHEIALDVDAVQRLNRLWNQHLATYMGQPRAIKRLVAQVDALWPELSGEVDFVDFLVVSFVRTFEQPVFDLVYRRRRDLLEPSPEDGRAGGGPAVDWNDWVDVVRKSGARYPQIILELLAELFPTLAAARSKQQPGPYAFEDARRRRGVGSAEFFDLYIQLSVPSGSASEALVKTAAGALRAGAARTDPALAALVRAYVTDPAIVVRKLRRQHDLERLPEEATLALMAEFYEDATRSGSEKHSPAVFAVFELASVLLGDASAEGRTDLLARLSGRSGQGLSMVRDLADLDHLIHPGEAGGPLMFWNKPLREHLATTLRSRIDTESRGPIDESTHVMDDAQFLAQLVTADAVQALLWGLIDSPDTSLRLADCLALLVPVGQARAGDRLWTSFGSVPLEQLDGLLGARRVVERLGPLGTQGARDADDVAPALAERARHALDELQILRPLVERSSES